MHQVIYVWGLQPNGEEWTIGIADPNAARTSFSYLSVSNAAIATSGNYEKFITIDGKRYSHTIDPKTGLPVTGIKSVTIISPNAEIANAMATPVMIMGIKVGLDLVNQLKGIECIIVDDNDKIYTSKNINIHSMKLVKLKPKVNRLAVVAVSAVAILSSCTTVKEYQKNKLNDGEMTLSSRKIQKTESSFQSYREGCLRCRWW